MKMQFMQPPPLYSSGDKGKKIMTNPVDAYPYTGRVIGNDAEDHLEYEPATEALAEMKLTLYKGLNGEPIIKYLYTGREYNIETGDYYYRTRIYDQSRADLGIIEGKGVEYDDYNAYISETRWELSTWEQNNSIGFKIWQSLLNLFKK